MYLPVKLGRLIGGRKIEDAVYIYLEQSRNFPRCLCRLLFAYCCKCIKGLCGLLLLRLRCEVTLIFMISFFIVLLLFWNVSVPSCISTRSTGESMCRSEYLNDAAIYKKNSIKAVLPGDSENVLTDFEMPTINNCRKIQTGHGVQYKTGQRHTLPEWQAV